MLKNRCIYLLILLSTVIFFLCYKKWLAWYCLMTIILIPIISLFICLLSGRAFDIKVEAPKSIEIGDDASLILRSRGRLSILAFCRFSLSITDMMTDTSSTRITDIRYGSSSEIGIDTTHCGRYIYGFSDMRIYDLFGLFYMKKKAPAKCNVMVRPKPQIPKAVPNLSGFKAKGLRKSNSPNTEIYDIREYTAGDPIKSVHWKISAKKDQLFIKEPQEEYFGHSRIIMHMTRDRDKLDKRLGEILFTSNYFLKNDVTHKIRVTPPTRRDISFDIETQRDLDLALLKILSMKIPTEDQNAEQV